ncbi:MAG: homoserine dehydrogenase [Gammaproteobacteria bacterium]|nr:homoserine dehydrogenase [Gammaproteobacteria bacterium]MDA7736956.1 homoserine dehydrogenase [Porticoccus sp.]MDC0887864.1 homoserine dehydrogenase [Porticoccus sp.]
MKSVNIGICGLGTVGRGTINVLKRNSQKIKDRLGCEILLNHIGSRTTPNDFDLKGVSFNQDVFAIADNPKIDILVELIGGTSVAKDLVLKAIENGKHVVTANKALIAEHGNQIFQAAEKKGVTVAFEAAVAGGIPIVKALREGLVANNIEWVVGIINGTSNFILTEMRDKNRTFPDVLKEAKNLGYAEADPTFDVEGVDAAHKLAILASLAFGHTFQFDKIFTEGITKIEPQDVAYAEQLGYCIKHLGIARKVETEVELRVHPVLIPKESLIANVDGVMNAVLVKGDAVGPTMYYGPGAGAEPTASAVISDICDIARTIESKPEQRIAPFGYKYDNLKDVTILPICEVRTASYMRVTALDVPGVLVKITKALSEENISIEAIIQKEPAAEKNHVQLILLTNNTIEKYIDAAINKIEALDVTKGDIVKIRVESLN